MTTDNNKEIVVEPKNKTVYLMVLDHNSQLRCLEHVGGNTLSCVIEEQAAKKKDSVVAEKGALINPIGEDAYKVTKAYVTSIVGILDIELATLEDIHDNDMLKLVIVL